MRCFLIALNPKTLGRTLSLATLLLFVPLAGLAQNSYASPTLDSDSYSYFSIASVEVTELPSPAESTIPPIRSAPQDRPSYFFDSVFSTPDQFIISLIGGAIDPSQIGDILAKIWKIIVENKPTATINTQRISILPDGGRDWSQMENWQPPARRVFQVDFKNLLGMTAVTQKYAVSYNYGGSLNGKGRYLANAGITPIEVSVIWGYTLNAQVEIANAVNTGTKEDPVAGLELGLRWKLSTVVKVSEGTESFFIKGTGECIHLSGDSQPPQLRP